MRLLFIHNGADLYGASRSFLRLCGRLVRDGVVVKAVLPCDGPLREALLAAHVDTVVLRPLPVIERQAFRHVAGLFRLLFRSPLSVLRLCRLIRAFKPDLLHSNLSVLYTPAIAARLTGTPHVWHIRESYTEFGLFWRVYRRFMGWGADRIVAVSAAVAGQFAESLAGKVRIVHNGFPAAEFEPVPAERICAFKDRYATQGELLVGLVGRIKLVRKGQDVLVEAAAVLKPRFPNVRYLLIGSPFPGNEEHLARLRQRIRELGVDDCVVVTGDVSDIKAAYAALDVSVMASGLPEPFGGVVVESMALCKPVVGSAVGGTVEQIEDGVTGLLVPPRDPVALAEALARLLQDRELRGQMGKAGRRRFESHFEFEPFYHKIRTVYSEVCVCDC